MSALLSLTSGRWEFNAVKNIYKKSIYDEIIQDYTTE